MLTLSHAHIFLQEICPITGPIRRSLKLKRAWKSKLETGGPPFQGLCADYETLHGTIHSLALLQNTAKTNCSDKATSAGNAGNRNPVKLLSSYWSADRTESNICVSIKVIKTNHKHTAFSNVLLSAEQST